MEQGNSGFLFICANAFMCKFRLYRIVTSTLRVVRLIILLVQLCLQFRMLLQMHSHLLMFSHLGSCGLCVILSLRMKH